jgi:hypothetical protein
MWGTCEPPRRNPHPSGRGGGQNLDPVTRYIMVRELLDEWRERRKERLAKMNPHPSTIEQIGSGGAVEMEDVEGIIKKFNVTLESMFEKYESTIEEMIKKYL